MKLKMQKLEFLWLLTLVAVSSFFGFMYAVHQIDSHHYGFITGTILDFISGKHLFTEVFIQYGVGEPILFKLLSFFMPINITTVGLVTSLFYSLNLVMIYLNVKKVSNVYLAVLLSALAILLHTFAIYPWPDYYAGFFLSLACYCVIENGGVTKVGNFVLAGALLFIAFLFRNTYLPAFVVVATAFGMISLMFKRVRSKNFIIMFSTLFILIALYILFLYLQGTLSYWYAQDLGAGVGQWGVGVNAIVDLVKQALFPTKFYLPNNIVLTLISAFFYISLYVIVSVLWSKKIESTTLFFALLGFSSMAQATKIFDVFRIQNAGSSLYLVAAILIHSRFPNFFNLQFKKRWLQVATAYIFVLLMLKIPHASTYSPVYKGDFSQYQTSSIPYFRWHRFEPDHLRYYEELHRYLCDGHRKIINYTIDSTIPYLCEGQQNALSLPFYYEPMLSWVNEARVDEIKRGDFKTDEVIVSVEPVPTNPNVRLIEVATVVSPVVGGYSSRVKIFHVER